MHLDRDTPLSIAAVHASLNVVDRILSEKCTPQDLGFGFMQLLLGPDIECVHL